VPVSHQGLSIDHESQRSIPGDRFGAGWGGNIERVWPLLSGMGFGESQDRDGSSYCAIDSGARGGNRTGAGCVGPLAHANASFSGAKPLGASSIGNGAGLKPSGRGLETETVGSFEQQMLPHLGAAFTLARYLLREPADAEDAVQEAYLQALRHFGGFRGENARAWLLTIVRRICYAWADRGRRHGWPADPELLDELPGSGEDPESELIRGELQERLALAVEALPLPFREVIVLRELQELSYQEIAAVTGMPLGTVMSRLSRARRRLQRALEAQGMGG
jgi:RNA polymerase sigma-70 factor (ECF subfamily)